MTFKILTFGCKVNAYESESLRERLLRENFIETEGKEKADIYFINTCAVTAEAEKKDIKKVKSLIKNDPDCRIAVMGCSSQLHKERYLAFPNVIAVIGNHDKDTIETLAFQKAGDKVNPDFRHFTYQDTPVTKGENQVRGYLKVQDGCNNFCSYCVVPYTRGNSRSRNKDSILREAQNMLNHGVKELIISGIDVGSYRDQETPEYDLTTLLSDLVKIEGYEFRIRVSSIEASQITEDYVKLFAEHPDRLCPHFHMPLQSGSEKILKLMNRKYSLSAFEEKIDMVKRYIPDVALSTDVITGFPSEGEEEFQETVDFLRRNCFMRIHAFPYSERPFTGAAKMKNPVPVRIREDRVKVLISLSQENENSYRKQLEGKECKVLIEEIIDGQAVGYSENYLRYSLPGKESDIGALISLKNYCI